MNYRIEIHDTWGRRISSHDEVPLFEARRTAPDKSDVAKGIIPGNVTDLGHGYRLRIFVDDVEFLEVSVTEVEPQWGDEKKLILDRFVQFHETIEVAAERPALDGNTRVVRGYTNLTVEQIVRDSLNSALGDLHYWVDHAAYPDGAIREFGKFSARKTSENELEVGGIATGQWVAAARIDSTLAVAVNGNTITGLKVDGNAWPDVRLLMIEAEEVSKNAAAEARHPEVASWTSARYNASGYKLKADAAKTHLQSLIDTKTIDFIELNPHRDITGAFDGRVDESGRYVALVYGSGECFNAAMVENGHADVVLKDEGAFLVPSMELKDFFSYTGSRSDSVDAASTLLSAYDIDAGIMEILTSVAYAAGGYVWSIDNERGVQFRAALRPDRVIHFDPLLHAVSLGSSSENLVNTITVEGNPLIAPFTKTYIEDESVEEFGIRSDEFDLVSVSQQTDADTIVNGLLEDVAYPEVIGSIVFLQGDSGIEVGQLIELRGVPLRRVTREPVNEWGGRFPGKLVARVKEVRHRFRGKHVVTEARLTSPLRSSDQPTRFIVRSAQDTESLFQFRLDEPSAGLDSVYHID